MANAWHDFDHYEVEYMDGRPAEESRPSLLARLEVERRWPEGAHVGDDGKIQLFNPRPREEAAYFMAWHGLGKPGNDFDAWLASVRDIREVTRAQDPSVPAAGDA